MSTLENLLSPINIGTMQLKNRVAMAPMATNWANPDGTMSETITDYFEARAKGGVGLIVLEVTTIDSTFPYVPQTICLSDDNHIPAMRRFTDTMHSHGTKVIPQISHPGPESLSWLFHNKQPVGPSASICHSYKQMCRELSVEEIQHIIEQFGDAALRARESGCDGIELHAAHCYMLLGSFISALRNKRTDKYGGSLEARLKLPLEVIKCIREKAGEDFPIVMRISGDEVVEGGRNIHETQYIAPILVDAGINAFDVSAGVFPERSWRILPPTGTPFGINTKLSAAIKEVVDVPVITVGRILDPRFAEDILQREEADMVMLGRGLLADQDWVNKAAEGRFEDIAPCVGCGVGCISSRATGSPMSCVINPTVGRERELTIEPAEKFKNVMVIGGGPGGLEAARIAALRGHKVTIFEKDSKVGGQLNLAAVPPMKQELAKWVKYLLVQVEKASVEIKLNTEVTSELVQEVKPDVAVVAVGSEAFVPDFPGIDNPKVVTAHDVLAGKTVITTGNVVVLGGGMVGCEVADFLANRGDNPIVGRTAVTIVTSKKETGLDMVSEIRTLLIQRLHEKGVVILNSSVVKEIIDDGVIITHEGNEETLHDMNHIVLARGVKSVDTLSDKIKDHVDEVYVIGDAKEPREALEAIAEGTEIARNI